MWPVWNVATHWRVAHRRHRIRLTRHYQNICPGDQADGPFLHAPRDAGSGFRRGNGERGASTGRGRFADSPASDQRRRPLTFPQPARRRSTLIALTEIPQLCSSSSGEIHLSVINIECQRSITAISTAMRCPNAALGIGALLSATVDCVRLPGVRSARQPHR